MTKHLVYLNNTGELTHTVRKAYQGNSHEKHRKAQNGLARHVNEVKMRMAEIVIDASELKGEGNDVIQALASFVKEKTSAEVSAEGQKVTVKGEGAAVSKKYLRVLVKKFLHKRELKENYRVISSGEEENTLKVKEKKTYEE